MKVKATALVALVSVATLSASNTSTAMARGLRVPPERGTAPAAAMGHSRGGSARTFANQSAAQPSAGMGRFGRRNSNNGTTNNYHPASNQRGAQTAASYPSSNGQSSSYPKSAYPSAPPPQTSAYPSSSAPPPSTASYPSAASYPSTASYPTATTTATVPPAGTYTLNVAPPYPASAYQQPYSAAPAAAMGGAMLGGLLGGALQQHHQQQQQSQQPQQQDGGTVTNNYYNSPSGAPGTTTGQPNGIANQTNSAPTASSQVSGQVVQPQAHGLQWLLQQRQARLQQQQAQSNGGQ